MSTYEEFQIILTVALLIVAILNIRKNPASGILRLRRVASAT